MAGWHAEAALLGWSSAAEKQWSQRILSLCCNYLQSGAHILFWQKAALWLWLWHPICVCYCEGLQYRLCRYCRDSKASRGRCRREKWSRLTPPANSFCPLSLIHTCMDFSHSKKKKSQNFSQVWILLTSLIQVYIMSFVFVISQQKS